MMALAQMEQSLADRELARAAGRGDRAAFAALVERHYDFIYRVSWRLTGSRTEAEDIAQDVCARLGVAIRTYRADSAFTTWLYAIITNACVRAKKYRHGRVISQSRIQVPEMALLRRSGLPCADCLRSSRKL